MRKAKPNIKLTCAEHNNDGKNNKTFVIIITCDRKNGSHHRAADEILEKINGNDLIFKNRDCTKFAFESSIDIGQNNNNTCVGMIIQEVQKQTEMRQVMFYFSYTGHKMKGNESGDLNVQNILKLLKHESMEKLQKIVYINSNRAYFYNEEKALDKFADEFGYLLEGHCNLSETAILFNCQLGCNAVRNRDTFDIDMFIPSFTKIMDEKIKYCNTKEDLSNLMFMEYQQLDLTCKECRSTYDDSPEIFLSAHLLNVENRKRLYFLDFYLRCKNHAISLDAENSDSGSGILNAINQNFGEPFGVPQTSEEVASHKFLICIVKNFEMSDQYEYYNHEEAVQELTNCFNKLDIDNLNENDQKSKESIAHMHKDYETLYDIQENVKTFTLYLESQGTLQYISDGKKKVKLNDIIEQLNNPRLKDLKKFIFVGSCRNFYNEEPVWNQMSNFLDESMRIRQQANCCIVYSCSAGGKSYWPIKPHDGQIRDKNKSPFLKAVVETLKTLDITNKTDLFNIVNSIREKVVEYTKEKDMGAQYPCYICTMNLIMVCNETEPALSGATAVANRQRKDPIKSFVNRCKSKWESLSDIMQRFPLIDNQTCSGEAIPTETTH